MSLITRPHNQRADTRPCTVTPSPLRTAPHSRAAKPRMRKPEHLHRAQHPQNATPNAHRNTAATASRQAKILTPKTNGNNASKPKIRPAAPTSSPPKKPSRRQSSGPLSANTMSRIRCPSRVDFLNAVSGVSPSVSCYGSANALARSRSQPYAVHKVAGLTVSSATPNVPPLFKRCRPPATHLTPHSYHLADEVTEYSSVSSPNDTYDDYHGSARPAYIPGVLNSYAGRGSVLCQGQGYARGAGQARSLLSAFNEVVLCDGNGGVEDEEEEGVPQYLNESVLDAMDHISECDELRAIVEWMNDVRKEHGFRRSLTDVDLTNGVAMLQVLKAVAEEAFIGEGEEACVIEMELDAAGIAARDNIDQLRAALRRFPWRDGPDGTPLRPVSFERVDVWGLAGFVLLAGLTGGKADVEVRRILDMEEWMQDRLSDVLASGLEALGVEGVTGAEVDDVDNRDNRCGGWFAERRKREELEDQVRGLRSSMEELIEERDQLVLDLVSERRRAEQVRAELRKLRAAVGRRKRVLGDVNNDGQCPDIDAESNMKSVIAQNK